MTYPTPAKQAEKHFNTARTPKHNNRSGKKDTERPSAVYPVHPSVHPAYAHHGHHPVMQHDPASPRRRVGGAARPPSPSYDYYYGYHGRGARDGRYHEYYE
jgi:hypothetical protein